MNLHYPRLLIFHVFTRFVFHSLKDYMENHPEVTVLDPPAAIQRLYNRQSMLQDVADLNLSNCYGKLNQSLLQYVVCQMGLVLGQMSFLFLAFLFIKLNLPYIYIR